MRKAPLFLLLLSFSAAAAAHVSPNVTLVRRGDFLRQAFPDAAGFFEKALERPPAGKELHGAGWRSSSDEARIYVARTAEGKVTGTAVFLWIPSQHGPIGIGVAFDAEGAVRQAAVTDVGAEPLAWVRPLLVRNRVDGLAGLRLNTAPDPNRLAPAGAGTMTRYYAKVVAEAVSRAQAIERAALEEIR